MTSHNHRIQEEKMRHIKLKNYKKVFRQYMLDNPEIIEFIDKRNSNDDEHLIQNGGEAKTKIKNQIPKKIKYVHDNIEYILYEIRSKDGYDISMRRKDDINNPMTCLHIIIDSSLKLAYVQNISYYSDCVSVGLERPGGGSKLLKMCIQFLKDTRNRYSVKRIQLKDNSYFICQNNNKRIKFSLMHTLLYADTWYGKYGFRPYDPMNDTEDKELTEIYDNNKKIITTTKTKDTNLYNCLHRILKEQNKMSDEEIKQKIDKYYAQHKDETIDVFFRKFLMNFDNACAIFSVFYVSFCDSLRVHNFTGESFYLDI